MKFFHISILFCCTLLISSCGDSWKFIKTRGNPAKNISLYKPNRIFPLGFDVSIDDKIYFSFQNDSSIVICSMDIATGNLQQITENGNSDFHPVVSHNGKIILFKRGDLFGNNNNFYTINTDGKNCKKLLDTAHNIYLSDAVFSNNDSVIYFVGGALYNDTSFATRSFMNCQDIFSVNSNGTNFKRLTNYCITTWVNGLLVTSDNHLMISFKNEVDFYNEPKVNNVYYKYLKKEKVITRKPFPNIVNAKLNLKTGDIQEINITVDNNYFLLNKSSDTIPSINNPAIHPNGSSCVLNESSGIFNFDFTNNKIQILVDSIDNIPFTIGKYPNKKFTSFPDTIKLYNYKYMGTGYKLIGGVGDLDNYRFGILDIKSKKIEKYLSINPNKFTPTKNRTIFNQKEE